MGVTEIFNFRLIAIFHYIISVKSAQLVTTFALSAKNPTDQKKVSLCFFFLFLPLRLTTTLYEDHKITLFHSLATMRGGFFSYEREFFFSLLDHLFFEWNYETLKRWSEQAKNYPTTEKGKFIFRLRPVLRKDSRWSDCMLCYTLDTLKMFLFILFSYSHHMLRARGSLIEHRRISLDTHSMKWNIWELAHISCIWLR